jgi:hypothetical protein
MSEQHDAAGKTKPHKRVWHALYFVVCNTLLLLLAVELSCRAIGGGHRQGAAAKAASPDDVPYTLHPTFQLVFEPGHGTLTGPVLPGWRMDPVEDLKLTTRKKILFLGGSTTATNYPVYTRRVVETTGPKALSILCAYDWHCSLHSLYKLWTYGDEVKPDLVVVLECINDFYRGFTSPDASLPEYHTDYSHYAGGLYPFWIRGKSRLDGRNVFYARPARGYSAYEQRDFTVRGFFRAIFDNSAVLSEIVGVSGPPTRPPPVMVSMPDEVILRALPEFRRNMRNIAQTCRGKRWPVLFLTMPWTLGSRRTFLPPGNFFTNDGEHHLDKAGFELGMRAFNDEVRKLDSELGETVLDLESLITDPVLFIDEVHLKEKGLQTEARLVGEYILEHGLFKPAESK